MGTKPKEQLWIGYPTLPKRPHTQQSITPELPVPSQHPSYCFGKSENLKIRILLAIVAFGISGKL